MPAALPLQFLDDPDVAGRVHAAWEALSGHGHLQGHQPTAAAQSARVPPGDRKEVPGSMSAEAAARPSLRPVPAPAEDRIPPLCRLGRRLGVICTPGPTPMADPRVRTRRKHRVGDSSPRVTATNHRSGDAP